jgi:hypothetical protein
MGDLKDDPRMDLINYQERSIKYFQGQDGEIPWKQRKRPKASLRAIKIRNAKILLDENSHGAYSELVFLKHT